MAERRKSRDGWLRLTIFYFGGKLAEYRRAAGCAGWLELHVFDPGEVGVEEVELYLAVFAHLSLGAVGAFAVVAGKGLDDGIHVGSAQREVIEHTELLCGGIGAAFEHVLKPVGAVGYLDADPVGLAFVHAAVPVGMEAEEVFIEAVFGGGILDHEAGVDNAVRWGAWRGYGKAGNLGAFLDKVDEVAFGVVDGEEAVSERLHDGDVAGLEVALERGGVTGGERDGSEAAGGSGCGKSFYFQPLQVVDRVAGDTVTVGMGVAEGVAVEVCRGCGVGGVHADEGDAGYGRTLLREGDAGNGKKKAKYR
jgi:hypothetical protein